MPYQTYSYPTVYSEYIPDSYPTVYSEYTPDSYPTAYPEYMADPNQAQTNFFPFLGAFGLGLGLGVLPWALAGRRCGPCGPGWGGCYPCGGPGWGGRWW